MAVLQEAPASVSGLFIQSVEAHQANGEHGDYDEGKHNGQRPALDATLRSGNRIVHDVSPSLMSLPGNAHISGIVEWRNKEGEGRFTVFR